MTRALPVIQPVVQELRAMSVHRPLQPSPFASRIRLPRPVPPTPDHPLIISASELRDFLRCRVKWWWRHQCRLEPKARSVNLVIGNVVHVILEHWYAGDRSRKRMRQIARDVAGDAAIEALSAQDRELVEAMCVGYARWALGNHEHSDREQLGLRRETRVVTEDPFELKLTSDGSILVRGIIDNHFVPSHLKRTVAFSEFKTRSQFRDSPLELVTQLSTYLWALRQKFPKARRYLAFHTELRKQLPGPRVHADLFRRELVERTDDEVDQWIKDTQRAALDMLDAAIYPNPMESCSWECDFQTPCLARSDEHDLAHVLETGYQQRPSRGVHL